MSTSDLADRIRALEDRAAITELAVRYCIAIDDGDYESLVPMYTDQATLGRAVGGRAVVDLLQSIRASYGRTVHVPEAHSITLVDDTHATGIVLSHAELAIEGRTVHTYIRYYDEYARGADGAWRFSARELKFAYAVPVDQLADSLTGTDTVRWPGSTPVAADDFADR